MAACKKFYNFYNPIINNVTFLIRNSLHINQQLCRTVSMRSVEKKLGIPPRPKRPLSPFFKFLRDERPKFVEQHPGTNSTQTVKMLSNKWAVCDPVLKEKYQHDYHMELDAYVKQVVVYEKSLTDQQKLSMKEETEKQQLIEEKNKKKTKLRELGRPKRPPTAFLVYLLSKKNKKSNGVPFITWINTIAKEWLELPPEEKEQYFIEGQKLMEIYKNDLIRWEEKMVKMGHTDVVRRRKLMDLKDKNSS